MNSGHQHSPKNPACLEVFAQLSEYLDGELTAEACEAIESHIADCPPCVEFVRNLRECIGATRHMQADCQPVPMPKELDDRLRAAWSRALARRNS